MYRTYDMIVLMLNSQSDLAFNIQNLKTAEKKNYSTREK